MEKIINKTSIVFNEKLKIFMCKLKEKIDISSLKFSNIENINYTQDVIRNYLINHQNEIDKTNNRFIHRHCLDYPNHFFIGLCVISNLEICDNHDDIMNQNEGYHKFDYEETRDILEHEVDGIDCMCGHNIHDIYSFKNTITNMKIIVGCDCIKKNKLASDTEIKNEKKIKRILKTKKQKITDIYKIFVMKTLKKHYQMSALFRQCDECKSFNIKRDEPLWKNKCRDCYFGNIPKGKCVIKLEKN